MTSSWILFISCIAICLRLFTFKRQGSRFRPGVSLAAWAVMAFTGGMALKQAFSGLPFAVTPLMAYLAVVFAILVFLSDGNLAHIFRIVPHDATRKQPHRD